MSESDEEGPGEKSAVARLLGVVFGLRGLVFGVGDTRFQVGDFLLVLFAVELLLAAGEGQLVFIIAGNFRILAVEILPEFELITDGSGGEGRIGEFFCLQRLALRDALVAELGGEGGLARTLGLQLGEVFRRQEIRICNMVVHQLHLAAIVKKHEPVADLGLAMGRTEHGMHGGKRVAKMDFNRGGQQRRGEQEKGGEGFHGEDGRYLN